MHAVSASQAEQKKKQSTTITRLLNEIQTSNSNSNNNNNWKQGPASLRSPPSKQERAAASGSGQMPGGVDDMEVDDDKRSKTRKRGRA